MERNKRNTLVHLLATQREYRKPGSRNSNQSNCATNKSKVVARLYGGRLCFAYRIVNGVVIGRRVITTGMNIQNNYRKQRKQKGRCGRNEDEQ